MARITPESIEGAIEDALETALRQMAGSFVDGLGNVQQTGDLWTVQADGENTQTFRVTVSWETAVSEAEY